MQPVRLQIHIGVPAQAYPTVPKKEPRRFSSLPAPPSQLLPELIAADLITPIPLKTAPNPSSKSYDPNARGGHYMGASNAGPTQGNNSS